MSNQPEPKKGTKAFEILDLWHKGIRHAAAIERICGAHFTTVYKVLKTYGKPHLPAPRDMRQTFLDMTKEEAWNEARRLSGFDKKPVPNPQQSITFEKNAVESTASRPSTPAPKNTTSQGQRDELYYRVLGDAFSRVVGAIEEYEETHKNVTKEQVFADLKGWFDDAACDAERKRIDCTRKKANKPLKTVLVD